MESVARPRRIIVQILLKKNQRILYLDIDEIFENANFNKFQFYFIADIYNQNFQERIQRINELPQ